MGLYQAYVSSVERGERDVTMGTVHKIWYKQGMLNSFVSRVSSSRRL